MPVEAAQQRIFTYRSTPIRPAQAVPPIARSGLDGAIGCDQGGRSFSAPAGVNASPSRIQVPEVCMSAMYQVLPSGEIFTSCGIGCAALRWILPITSCLTLSTLSRSPENSQLAMKVAPVWGEVGVVDPVAGDRDRLAD